MTAQTNTFFKRIMREEEPEWIVWALVALMLVIGIILKTTMMGRSESFTGGGVSLSYPHDWTRMATTSPEQVLHAADPFSAAQFPTGVQVRVVPLKEIGRNLDSMNDIAMAWSMQHSRDLVAYSALDAEPLTVDGTEALALSYAHVVGGDTGNLPVVARAQDVLLKRGDNVIVITFAADATFYETTMDTWQTILASVEASY